MDDPIIGTDPGINLPNDPQVWDEFRILYTSSTDYADGTEWNIISETGSTLVGGGSGTARMWGKLGPGFRVKSYSRRCLPEIGEATIEAPYGIINGEAVNCVVSDNTKWNPQTDYIDTPDILQTVVRIQARRGILNNPDATGSSSGSGSSIVNGESWRTVWIGVCLWQSDDSPPAANNCVGWRRWHCVDLLYAYARSWFLDTHGFSPTSGVVHSPCYGMPGFNIGKNKLRKGNKSTVDTWTVDGLSMPTHVIPGSQYSTEWTDAEVLEYMLTFRRKSTDPLFVIEDKTLAFLSSDMKNEWSFTDADTAWYGITTICRRQRGKGLALMDWDDDANTPTGQLSLYLRLQSQVATDSSGYVGASAAGTATDVYLTGDHRAVDDQFQISERAEEKYDYVETRGDKIQVAITVSYTDQSLEIGWDSDLATEYVGKSDLARLGPKYKDVYQLHNLTDASGRIFKAADGKGGTLSSFAYSMNPTDGTISAGTTTENSLAAIQVMDTLPFLDGYDYTTTTPTAYSGTVIPDDPGRRKPLLMIKETGVDRFWDWDGAYTFTSKANGALIQIAGDDSDEGSFRSIGDTTKPSLESAENYTDLTLTVCVELPNRIRYGTGTSTSSRQKIIYVKDHAVALAHPGTIWSLDNDTYAYNGISPKRMSALYYVRDDRTRLQYIHTLACQWYLGSHVSASWALKCNGTYGSYRNNPQIVEASGIHQANITYPKLGYLVEKLFCSGTVNATYARQLNTPITSIEYDNDNGVTTWRTDWSELDLGAYNE